MTQERETEAPGQKPEWQGESSARETPNAGEIGEGIEASGAAETPAEAANGSEEVSPERLTVLLEDARAKADEGWDQLLRLRAEMENLKRRHANELEKAHKFALDGFVRELLQVRDSLELGHNAALDQSADVDKLREGTELTLKLLSDVMAKFGVEQIDPEGEPFNPEFHQAMTMQPRADLPPNTVVTVVQRGYLLNGRLVRPAMVIVSAGAGPEQS
jgi:molecular chaperone GrpE